MNKNRLYKIKMKVPTEINIIRFKNYKNLLVRILRENERVYYTKINLKILILPEKLGI